MAVKSCLSNPSILAMPIDTGQYILDTDCSGQAADAVLSRPCKQCNMGAERSLGEVRAARAETEALNIPRSGDDQWSLNN